ncbi:unnamed protein product [Closterium sp. Yama58-4]|nr:unnamed protein product [Closterium sp. Yama58-4]
MASATLLPAAANLKVSGLCASQTRLASSAASLAGSKPQAQTGLRRVAAASAARASAAAETSAVPPAWPGRAEAPANPHDWAEPKAISLIGSTGSIGTQTLDIVAEHPDRFKVVALAAGSNIALLAQQVRQFQPALVSVQNPALVGELKEALAGMERLPEIVAGDSGIDEVARHPDAETVVTGIVGCAGLKPTVAAIEAGKDIALANKETLIAGGPYVLPLAKKHGCHILPADSEHSAIFQCIQGLPEGGLRRIILTASGGAFRDWPVEKLKEVTPADALKHPNWSMGRKITVDSATLMNKGLEVIEAHYLFGADYDNIDIVIHPQSIIHSMVETQDSSVLAQLGWPDMRLPILYTLSWPDRVPTSEVTWPRLDFIKMGDLTFREPNRDKYPSMDLSYAAGRAGGTMTGVLSAANEQAVEMFLDDKIHYLDICRVIEGTCDRHRNDLVLAPSLEDIVHFDQWARVYAAEGEGNGEEVSGGGVREDARADDAPVCALVGFVGLETAAIASHARSSACLQVLPALMRTLLPCVPQGIPLPAATPLSQPPSSFALPLLPLTSHLLPRRPPSPVRSGASRGRSPAVWLVARRHVVRRAVRRHLRAQAGAAHCAPSASRGTIARRRAQTPRKGGATGADGGRKGAAGGGLLCGCCAWLGALCARLRPSRKANWPYALVSVVFVALVASEQIAPLLPSTARARGEARAGGGAEEEAVSGPLTRMMSAMWGRPSPTTPFNARSNSRNSNHSSRSNKLAGGPRDADGGAGGGSSGGLGGRAGGKVGEAAGVAAEEESVGRGSGGGGGEEEECSECWKEVDRLRTLRERATGARRRLLVEPGGTVEGLQAAVAAVEAEMAALKAKMSDLAVATEQMAREAGNLRAVLQGEGHWATANLTRHFLHSTAPSHPDRCAVLSLDRRALQRQSKRGPKGPPLSWKGYTCEAAPSQIQRYTDVEARALCPDDWFFVQELVFLKNCFALPTRRCLARTPQQPTEPLPFPQSLFDQAALVDGGVRWEQQQCGSFHCLNTRALGDCRNCFNLSLESHRWQHRFRGNPTMQDVMQLKNGSLRLGLDVGGGTGSFAAHMARHGVTVMTTAMNYETVSGRHAGLPYFEAIAMRGLIPLFLPHKARLPFYDNTLDVIHSVNSVKYMPLVEFEELVFEWDRVLRPGGLMWFEMFYAPVDDMVLYVAVLQQLRYRRLHWTLMPKPDRGEIEAHQLYLNCVIEKPARRNALKPVEFI